jgi:hypothetical protein
MELSDVSVEASRIAPQPAGRALSAEVRASLEAVRVAQVDARVRARRQTMQTRIWFVLLVAGVGLAAVAVGPRLLRGRHARPRVSPTTPVTTAMTTTPPAEPAKATVAGALVGKPEPSAAKTESPESPAAAVYLAVPVATPIAAPAKARDIVGADEGCDTGLIRRAPWRLSAAACARAFESAGATNATLALAIAHAEHAHGSATAAADWARRALALDPTAAEAYVLIARADLKTGHDEDARTAYRRYLDLAPRGWHQREARDAVRAGRPTAPPDSDRASAR